MYRIDADYFYRRNGVVCLCVGHTSSIATRAELQVTGLGYELVSAKDGDLH